MTMKRNLFRSCDIHGQSLIIEEVDQEKLNTNEFASFSIIFIYCLKFEISFLILVEINGDFNGRFQLKNQLFL